MASRQAEPDAASTSPGRGGFALTCRNVLHRASWAAVHFRLTPGLYGGPVTQFDHPHPTPCEVDPDALTLERMCARGWPGLEQEWHGDWLLRAGAGFTGRANSVLVLGMAPTLLPQAIEYVHRWYADRALPVRFQLPTGRIDPVVAQIDAALGAEGWQQIDRVVVLIAQVSTLRALPAAGNPVPDVHVSIDSRPDPTWLSLYQYRGNPLPPMAITVLAAGTSPFFVTLHEGSDPVAVARGCVSDGWLGITAITVPARFRRRGFGTAVLSAAVGHAEGLGARSVYLQVSRDNTDALALYRGLGFIEHHGYHYRDRP